MDQHQSRTTSGPGYQQPQSSTSPWSGFTNFNRTPASASSSNNTYLLPSSPSKKSKMASENYRPKIMRTCGQRPACLVNASVTYCGNNQIYAFGGFDQYTDEGIIPVAVPHLSLYLTSAQANIHLVYNHVLRLDLGSLQWSLVDNYGDIPGVRMGM